MRASRLYPFVFAAVPVIHLASANDGMSTLPDLAQVLAVVLAVAGVVYLAARYLLPRPAGERLAPMATLLAMAGLLEYQNAARFFLDGSPRRAELLLAPAAVVLAAGLLLWAYRRPLAHERFAGFLTLMATLLVAFGLTDLANDHRRAARRLKESETVARMAAPIPGPARPKGPARDVYVLILDQYANQDVLREFYRYDNRPFLDSLRALGFYVPPVTRSNYTHTMLSIPSMLNAAHLTAIAREQGRAVTDPTIPNYLVQHSRVASYLQQRGYRYVFFPSHWWLATSEGPTADVEPRVWERTSPMRELGRTELRRALLESSSVPGRLLSTLGADADHVRRTLRGVALAPRLGRPVYVVAHVMSPHPPYAVKADCEPSPRTTNYRVQIECLNRQVLALVGELIRSSPVAPVIILQGDHGSKSLRFSDYPTAAAVPVAAIRERFGAFGAYYLPGGGAAAFGDTVTVVNVLGNVLRYYFGAELPREGDEQYLSVDRAPFDFRAVDPAWLTPPRMTVRDASAGASGVSGVSP